MPLRAGTEKEFNQACEALVAGWESRDRKGEAVPWLEAGAYELISHSLDADLQSFWRPRESLLSTKGPNARPNHFARGLRVIFAHAPQSIDVRARERMGVRLACAYRHYVPLPFLSGFLGPVNQRPTKAVKPGFERWIAYHRRFAQDNERDYDKQQGAGYWRDKYPAQIDELADTLRRDEFPSIADITTTVKVSKYKQSKRQRRDKRDRLARQLIYDNE